MAEYTIERLGHRGDGIAAGPIFAPLTLPGEVITGDLSGDRIDAPKIITPSTDRVAPPCKHFKRCGGCALQHATDEFVADWKVNVVKEALKAHDLPAPIRRLHTSPPNTRRRATFTGRRTKSGALVGFHARGSDVLIDVPGCQLVLPQILAAMPTLEALTILGASRKVSIALTITWSSAGPDIAVTDAKDLDRDTMTKALDTANSHEIARLTWNDETIATRAQPSQHFDGITVVPPPGAFLQATVPGENALRASVTDAVGGAKHIVDLFAGSGTFALPLARNAAVHAVESDPNMLQSLDHAWRHASDMHQVTTEIRDLFRRPLVPLDLRKIDAVVIDPPRAGAEAQVNELAQSDIPIIAMVSCNPITFAKDAKTLINSGFSLTWVDVVDQFRWSPHIELAAQFTK